MLKPHIRFLTILLAVFTLALTSGGFSAKKDHAVVIGVNDVSGLQPEIRGAANDANAFAEQLRSRGFEPIVLLNEKATRAAIEQAIAQGAQADHLVVYFAGLGSGPNRPRLLTHEDNKGLALEDLDATLLKTGAKSTTVILDTAFFGQREGKSGPSLYQSRYYKPPVASRETTIGADAAALPGLSHNKICYITASRFNEDAFEDKFDGQIGGVFTHFLCHRLQGSEQVAWQNIQWDVAAQVTAHLEDLQHPNFPTQYLANAALEGDIVAPTEYGGSVPLTNPNTPKVNGQAGRTLWTLFNVDRVDPSRLKLSMRPNQSEVKVQEPLEFQVEVGEAGYLVVVEHSVEGSLRPVFPRDGNILAAQVRAHQRVIIPETGIVAFADRPGKERLKAFLFSDIAAARDLLEGLDAPSDPKATFGGVSRQLADRGIRFVAADRGFHPEKDANSVAFGAQSAPTTSDLSFWVVAK